MTADQDASNCYGSTAGEYYYGYGCPIVSTGAKTRLLPVNSAAIGVTKGGGLFNIG